MTEQAKFGEWASMRLSWQTWDLDIPTGVSTETKDLSFPIQIADQDLPSIDLEIPPNEVNLLDEFQSSAYVADGGPEFDDGGGGGEDPTGGGGDGGDGGDGGEGGDSGGDETIDDGGGGEDTTSDEKGPEDEVAEERKNIWMAQHTERITDSPSNRLQRRYIIPSNTTLKLLGVSWDPFGNPNPTTGTQGAWQYTFILQSFASVLVPKKLKDSPPEDDKENVQQLAMDWPAKADVDWVPADSLRPNGRNDGAYSNVTYLELGELIEKAVSRLAIGDLMIVESQDNDVAVAARRDRHLLGVLNYDEARKSMIDHQQIAKVLSESLYDTTGEYVNPNDIEFLLKNKEEFEELATTIAISMGELILSMFKRISLIYSVAENVSKVIDEFWELVIRDPVPLDPSQGFNLRRDPDNYGSVTGHYAIFDVYCAPGRTGEFGVASLHNIGNYKDNKDVLTPLDPESIKSKWMLKIDAPQAPSDKDNPPVPDPPKLRKDDSFISPGTYNHPKPSINVVSKGPHHTDETIVLDAYDTIRTTAPIKRDGYEWKLKEPTNKYERKFGEWIPIDEGSGIIYETEKIEDPGEYQVELKVTDENNHTGKTYEDIDVQAPEKPALEIKLDRYFASPGEDITFTAANNNDEVNVEKWIWVLPDTSTKSDGDPRTIESKQTITEHFPYTSNRRQYTVKLIAKADNGENASTREQFSIAPAPRLDIWPAGESEGTESITIEPGDSVTPAWEYSPAFKIANYNWSSDGEIIEGPSDQEGKTIDSVVIEFTEPGDHQIQLWITDVTGASAVDTIDVTVEGEQEDIAPTVSLAGPAEVPSDAIREGPGEVRPDVTREGSGEVQPDMTWEYTATASDPDDGQITSYDWSVTGGTIVQSQDDTAQIEFSSSATTATVSVTVTDDEDQTASASMDVTVTEPPTVSLAGHSEVPSGVTREFTATASDPDDGKITSYDWSVDGATVVSSDNETADVSFPTTGGEATVTVTVTDDEDQTASDSMDVTVTEPPTVSLTGPDEVRPDVAGEGPGEVRPDVAREGPGEVQPAMTWEYTATASDPDDGQITSYDWSVTGGTIVQSQGETAQIEFTSGGSTETVSVTVTDDEGQTASDSMQVTVQGEPPTVSLAGPGKVLPGVTREFTATASDPDDGKITSYDWSVDGATVVSSDNETADVSFPTTGGEATVTVTVTDDEDQTASDSMDVTVQGEPPTVTVSGQDSVIAGREVSYSASATDPDDGQITSYDWSVTGGTIVQSQGDSARVTFSSSATTATVSVTVTDDEGQTASDSMQVTVTEPPETEPPEPPTVFLTGPSAAFPDVSNYYTASATDPDDGQITSYDWSVTGGEVVQSQGDSARVTFSSSATTATVSVTVTDDEGQTASDSMQVTVRGGSPGGPRLI